jgi:RNA polymerase sigma-70 factor (ECF subfamily)
MDVSKDSDKFLFKQVKDGNGSAFELLYKKNYTKVYACARYYINDVSLCHDISQDIFTYLWENRHKIEIQSSLVAYLVSATKNACINYINKQGSRYRYLSYIFDEGSQYQDGYDAINESALLDALNKAMEQLPEQCREIFQLSRLKGLKHKEIGALLKISPKTVETQIYRALKVMKKVLLFITPFII